MRALALCWIGIVFALAGCCGHHEESTEPSSESAAVVTEPCQGCCVNKSRSEMLKKSLEQKKNAQTTTE